MIPYLETHITEACNLKCRGCSHFSVFAKPKHKDLDEFRREFERLAEIEEIPIIRLMGGEPLLNPDFMEYLRIARDCFPNSKIELVTNGILSDKLLPHYKEINALDIGITVSDYHLDNQNMSMASARHDKGQLYNISLDTSGKQDAMSSFCNCDIYLNKWAFFQDGKFYLCCIAGTIHDFWDHFNLNWGFTQDDLNIDIFEHSAAEIEEFLNMPCELCRFCDTTKRAHSYAPFEKSKGDIKEWTV